MLKAHWRMDGWMEKNVLEQKDGRMQSSLDAIIFSLSPSGRAQGSNMFEMWGTGPHPNRYQGDEYVPTAAGMQHCVMTVSGTGISFCIKICLWYYHHDDTYCCRVCAINMSLCKK